MAFGKGGKQMKYFEVSKTNNMTNFFQKQWFTRFFIGSSIIRSKAKSCILKRIFIEVKVLCELHLMLI